MNASEPDALVSIGGNVTAKSHKVSSTSSKGQAAQLLSLEDAATLDRRLAASKQASHALAGASTAMKNLALVEIAAALQANIERIVDANKQDLERGRTSGLTEGLLDRLSLTPARIESIAAAVLEIVALPDPVGDSVSGRVLSNGIRVDEVRVPLGVVGAIYEARPNVTVDIAALALKSGNAVVLRGGTAAEGTNRVLIDVLRAAIERIGLPGDAVATVDDFGRPGARHLMQARDYVDVLIPRGSQALISSVVNESKVPVIETGSGVVHMFLDETAREDWSVDLVFNAKVQRPSVCNSLETLLVHKGAAERLLIPVLDRLITAGVTIYGDERVRSLYPAVNPITQEEWSKEHLSLALSVGIVDSFEAALEHIRRYSTKHTESIITNDLANAERFLGEVDSAVVMVNASTRFTDGGEFGFGAEVGVSTQKLHARGPMGLPALTSTKWLVRGAGHSRS